MAKDLEVALRITAKDSTGAAFGKTRAGVESISRQLEVARNAFLSFQGAMGLQSGLVGLTRLADEVQLVNARLKLVTGSVREFAEAQQFAYRVAAQTGTGFESVATLYTRLAQTGKDYGLSQQDIARTTESTAMALKVSGASVAESAAVVRQFSQALGSGVLRGDEFNSIMENGGRLAKALADGLGLPIGRLRELAEQGLLTTDVVNRALESQAGKLREEAARMPITVGQSLSIVRDAFGKTIDQFNASTGATAGISSAFTTLARSMDAIVSTGAVAAVGALTVAMVRGGLAVKAYVADLIVKITAERQAAVSAQAVAANEVAKAQATLASAQAAVAAATGMARLAVVQSQLVPAQQQLAAAQLALNGAMAAGTTVSRGLATALAFVGGPVGLILTALTAGATAWAIWGNRAETAADKAKNAIDRASEAAERFRKEQKFGTGDAAALREGIEVLEQRERLLNESVVRTGSKGAAAKLAEVRRALEENRKTLAAMETKESAAATGPTALGRELLGKGFETHLDQFRKKIDPLAAALKDLREEAKKAGIALDSPKFREAEALVRKSFAPKATAKPDRIIDPFDAELAALKAHLKTAEDVIEQSFRARLITEEQYIEAKAAAQRQALDQEEQELRQKLAAQQALAARLKGPRDADRLAEARNRIAEIQTQLDAIAGRRVAVEFEARVNLLAAGRELADFKSRLAREIAQATGTETPEMRRAAIEAEYSDMLARMGHDAQAADLVRRAIDVRAARAELAALETKWRETLERMRQAQDNANVLRDAGALTQAQAETRIVDAAKAAQTEMQAMLPTFEQALAALFPPEEVARRMENLRAGIAGVTPVAESLTTKIGGVMQSAFTDAFTGIITGTKKVSDAFRSMAASILQSLAKIFAQRAAEGIFKMIPIFGNAKGGVYDSPSLRQYANRIVNAPTLFTFANGGAPRLGLMGEAGAEAIMPLKRGPDGRLGVEAHGAGGGVVVNVSVDASGSRISGDPGAGRQLGDMIAGAVRQIIATEKRPGGLLAGA